MRKLNSDMKTAFISEAGSELKNSDYFGFVELDKYACYVIADGIGDLPDAESAKLAIQSVITTFQENPSMRKKAVRSYLNAANRELSKSQSQNRLKAAVTVVVTDYMKLRYGQAGNARLRLYRGGSPRYYSKDMSLTQEMIDRDELPFDVLAQHEERNNLYTYVGQGRGFRPYISGKIKLVNTDIVTLYTRGIWENVDEGELDDVFAEATDEPQPSLDNVEDMLLSRQPKDLGNYTMAVIFINKVFVDPNRKRRMKMMIIISAVVLAVLIVVGVVVFLVLRDRRRKREEMDAYFSSAQSYITDDNYVKAKEDAGKAQELAKKLRDKEKMGEIDAYIKLLDGILNGDGLLGEADYTGAQKAYLNAQEKSKYADNSGKEYIENALLRTREYMDVYDLLAAGDLLTEQGNYAKAEEKYAEAKKLAGSLYFDEGKKAAAEALEKIYEKLTEEEAERKEAAKKVSEETQAASDLMTQGDKALQDKDYDGAKTNYELAKEKFEALGDAPNAAKAQSKQAQAEQKLEEKDAVKAMAEQYTAAGEEALKNGDAEAAKKYYDMAKQIYAEMGMEEMAKRMEKKLEMEDPEAASSLAEEESGGAGGSGKGGTEKPLTTKEKKEKREEAETREEKGDEAFDEGDFMKAKRYYREARDLYEEAGEKEKAEDMQEKMEEAQEEYDRRLEKEIEEQKERQRLAQEYTDMGDDARREGNEEEALRYYRRARDLYIELDKPEMVWLLQEKIDALLSSSSTSSRPEDTSRGSSSDSESSSDTEPPPEESSSGDLGAGGGEAGGAV